MTRHVDSRPSRRAYRSIVSHSFVATLIVTVAIILGSRFVLVGLPLRRFAAPMTASGTALSAIGVAGLTFHCGAMFYRDTVEHVPGTLSAIRAVDTMGTASRLWFIVSAILLVIGLRRQHLVVGLAVVAALAAVGVTMYDHGPLRTHLNAIFVAVVIVAAVGAALVLPPWRRATSITTR